MQANVIPQTASATFNFRVAPWEDSKAVMAHIRKLIAKDPYLSQVEIEMVPDKHSLIEPSPVSSEESFGYRVVEETLHQTFGSAGDSASPPPLPDLLIAPGIMVANTGPCAPAEADALLEVTWALT